MNKNNSLFILILVCIGLIVLVFWLSRKLKKLALPNVFLITGAVKTGKTALAVYLAISTYIKNVVKWYIGRAFYFAIHHNIDDYPIKPMLYTNIPLDFKHNRLTKEMIYLQVKLPKKSVVLIDEAALFADSQSIRDKKFNDALMIWCKLFGHITYGGTCIYTSHTCSDLHYAIKRSLGRYLYIYQSTKYPLITIAKVREMTFSDDSSMVNDVNQDVELSMRTMIYFNRIYKKYDCYCYSTFVDNKVYMVDYDYEWDKKNLKADQIISFNPSIMNFGKETKEYEDIEK